MSLPKERVLKFEDEPVTWNFRRIQPSGTAWLNYLDLQFPLPFRTSREDDSVIIKTLLPSRLRRFNNVLKQMDCEDILWPHEWDQLSQNLSRSYFPIAVKIPADEFQFDCSIADPRHLTAYGLSWWRDRCPKAIKINFSTDSPFWGPIEEIGENQAKEAREIRLRNGATIIFSEQTTWFWGQVENDPNLYYFAQEGSDWWWEITMKEQDFFYLGIHHETPSYYSQPPYHSIFFSINRPSLNELVLPDEVNLDDVPDELKPYLNTYMDMPIRFPFGNWQNLRDYRIQIEKEKVIVTDLSNHQENPDYPFLLATLPLCVHDIQTHPQIGHWVNSVIANIRIVRETLLHNGVVRDDDRTMLLTSLQKARQVLALYEKDPEIINPLEQELTRIGLPPANDNR